MSTTTANRPRRLRIGSGAVLVPNSSYEAWHTRAIATPGLNEIERGVLAAIAASYRQMAERGYGMTLSYDRLGHRLDVDAVHVRWAVNHLVELGLVGVERGGGARANMYLLALPRRIAKSMLAAAADDVPAPPF